MSDDQSVDGPLDTLIQYKDVPDTSGEKVIGQSLQMEMCSGADAKKIPCSLLQSLCCSQNVV